MTNPLLEALESRLEAMPPELQAIYEDLHRNPAPVPHPTLRTGLESMLAAASAWLCAPDAGDSPGGAA